jgi:N-hydroxyarylamine O-acetyltransferase
VSASTIDDDLADQVLERLGLGGRPTVDPDGLAALYGRWGRSISFDNVRKLVSLHGGDLGPLPGLDATDFFENWLAHGVGGTCWPSANALTALARACGFDARRVTASMYDKGEPSHGTTIVVVDGEEWLVDSSMLTDRPVPLSTTGATALDDPVFATTAEPVAEGWLFGFPQLDGSSLPCRTLSAAETSHDFFAHRYEVSRTWSPFNEHLHLRRNRGHAIESFTAGRRRVRNAGGFTDDPLTGEALREALTGLALSEEILDRLSTALPGELG